MCFPFRSTRYQQKPQPTSALLDSFRDATGLSNKNISRRLNQRQPVEELEKLEWRCSHAGHWRSHRLMAAVGFHQRWLQRFHRVPGDNRALVPQSRRKRRDRSNLVIMEGPNVGSMRNQLDQELWWEVPPTGLLLGATSWTTIFFARATVGATTRANIFASATTRTRVTTHAGIFGRH